MWNYFKNRKLKKSQEESQKKLLAEQRVIAIKSEIRHIDEKVNTILREYHESETNEYEKINGTCPKCKSTRVNDRIKRQQGSIDGYISGERSLFSGSLYGQIKGELDTNEVNKCNECGHEWKKLKVDYKWSRDIFESEFRYIIFLLKAYYEVRECKFDALDLDEKYSSFEEKKDALMKEAQSEWSWKCDRIKKFWDGISIESFNILAEKYLDSWGEKALKKYYDEKWLIFFGFKKLNLELSK
jgi:predicted Zn-ribbon and HTH transcriptional regulator